MKFAPTLLCLVVIFGALFHVTVVAAESIFVDDQLHHIRNGDEQEWSSFPGKASGSKYEVRFAARPNPTEQTLSMTQVDVKQIWDIELNGTKLGRLHRDENSIRGYWEIPSETLLDGDNTLSVNCTAKSSDDIRIGDVQILSHPLDAVLNATTLEVRVVDEGTQRPSPCRITIISRDSLATTGASSTDDMAVRPGVIYCKGVATFGLPEGEYEIVAGRGPEYSIATQHITLQAGDVEKVGLAIQSEVPTNGFVACDTHVHTLTHSGHGDSTVRERMLTLAGEGIELPIATDHNVHISYRDLAAELNVDSYFTPVIGNEVTTKLGHFNVFPIASTDTPIPNYKAENWEEIFTSIYGTPAVRVAILNHARDIHSNYRPFGPEHHLAATGQNLDDWRLQANAMEIINSAAQQSDIMRLVHDWMGLLNSGRRLTPVGCSDSHDVARHFVGQGRTYIRCDDTNCGNINVDDAVAAFLAGKIVVSCGLNAEIRVNTTSGMGDVVPESERYVVDVDVKGPSWIEAHTVEIFVNGTSVFTKDLPEDARSKPGIKATVSTKLPVTAKQDAFVVAVVRGAGVTRLYWPIAKPYQPTSPDWKPECMAVTGAVWIDSDGDGQITSAKQYAQQLCETANNEAARVVQSLAAYDRSVALHAAAILMAQDEDGFVSNVLPATDSASDVIRTAFRDYRDLWRESQRARAGIK